MHVRKHACQKGNPDSLQPLSDFHGSLDFVIQLDLSLLFKKGNSTLVQTHEIFAKVNQVAKPTNEETRKQPITQANKQAS